MPFGLETAFTTFFFRVAFFFFVTDFLATTFFFAEEALEVVFFFLDGLAALLFFLAAVDLADSLALLFFATGFFFAVVFPFRGFLADALRTDFFEAINNPFYFKETMIVPMLNRTKENDSLSQVSQQESPSPSSCSF
ncbi:MAG: hypothetical protein JSU60_01895 [Nitrospirota bacterium]|nr:MAG: hypothetical protein JSU60_01895 [Nitrospirota bacterium]